jgi:hypothetical protein
LAVVVETTEVVASVGSRNRRERARIGMKPQVHGIGSHAEDYGAHRRFESANVDRPEIR